jgi:hypothetical protein
MGSEKAIVESVWRRRELTTRRDSDHWRMCVFYSASQVNGEAPILEREDGRDGTGPEDPANEGGRPWAEVNPA